jgi:aryl-alcohol dehydrogenase-like predicted oxidoreductase
MNAKGFGTLAALDAVAKAHGAKPGQIALAWLIARPSVTAPIVSATNLDQLAEMVKAPEIRLSAAEVAQIDAASG